MIVVTALFLAGCGVELQTQVDPVMVRYGTIDVKLRRLVETKGVSEAVSYLDTTVKADPALEDLCHGLSHVIGETAYQRFGYEEALQFESDVCGSGYVHGVIESYLLTVEDIASEILTLCPANAPKCYHGIGHGLMYRSRNDLPGSLALCDTLPLRKDKIQCAEGVFMENVEADPVSHPTDYLRAGDPFFPCRGQSDIYEGVCAFYAPRSFLHEHPRAYEDAFAWCETVEEGPRDACVKGVGEIAVKQNITDPLFVEHICDLAVPERRHYCIQGMVSYFIVHHGATSKARALCSQLKEENVSACKQVVRESEAFYPG